MCELSCVTIMRDRYTYIYIIYIIIHIICIQDIYKFQFKLKRL